MADKPIVEVCKKFTFAAKHQLPFHDGKCARDHGHNYAVVLCVAGEVYPDDENNPASGMVVDFYELKHHWTLLEEHLFDHHSLNDVLSNPTAENLCLWIVEYFNEMFVDRCWLSRVRVCETDDCYAEWRKP